MAVNKSQGGFTTLEVVAFTMVFAALLLVSFHDSVKTNLETQLIVAKKNALQQAQLSGGLTSAITQQVISTLELANADPSKITVSSPQTTPVPYGGMIEIDIAVTSNPTTGVDSSGKPNQSTDTLQAKGFVVSQYSP